MLRFAAALSLSLTLSAPLVARAEPTPPAAVKRPATLHYRGLEKLLKRFRMEAGSPPPGRVLAQASRPAR